VLNVASGVYLSFFRHDRQKQDKTLILLRLISSLSSRVARLFPFSHHHQGIRRVGPFQRKRNLDDQCGFLSPPVRDRVLWNPSFPLFRGGRYREQRASSFLVAVITGAAGLIGRSGPFFFSSVCVAGRSVSFSFVPRGVLPARRSVFFFPRNGGSVRRSSPPPLLS